MDWRIVMTAFVTVFIAELGDKTQLAALSLASGSREGKLAVFVGASVALVCTTALAVVAAELIARFVSPLVLKRASALVFVALGAVGLWSSRAG